MKKIPCVFQRHGRQGSGPTMVLDVVTPGCEWVLDGEGRATIKWDGTACLVRDGRLFKRYDRKPTKAARKRRRREERNLAKLLTPWALEDMKPAPEGWESCTIGPDLGSGHWPGWVPIDLYEPSDRWHREALENRGPGPREPRPSPRWDIRARRPENPGEPL
jgi:hypothetical protein